MLSARGIATDMGLIELPEGHRRSRYWRATSPGPDSTDGELQFGLYEARFMQVLMILFAVFSQGIFWRVVAVVGACFLTLSADRLQRLKSDRAPRSGV